MCRKGLFPELPPLLGHTQRGRVFRHTCFLHHVCREIDSSCSGLGSLYIISNAHVFSPPYCCISQVQKLDCHLPDRLLLLCRDRTNPPTPPKKNPKQNTKKLVTHYQSSQCLKVLWPSIQLFKKKSGKDKSAKDSEMEWTLVKNWYFTPEKFRF